MVMTAAPENGVAYEDARERPIVLGDFLPERREVVLNKKTYLAWVATNRRYPRRIQARLAQARDKYLRASEPVRSWKVPTKKEAPDQKPIPIPPEVAKAIGDSDLAYQEWMTVALTELLPGLRVEEAEIIDAEVVERVLGPEPEGLGYLAARVAPPADEADEAEDEGGEEQDSGPLTGTTPPLDSPVPSPPTP